MIDEKIKKIFQEALKDELPLQFIGTVKKVIDDQHVLVECNLIDLIQAYGTDILDKLPGTVLFVERFKMEKGK